MQFVIWLANHSLLGQRSLEDVIGIVGHQLKALGHKVIWNPSNEQMVHGDSGINVIVEGFTPFSTAVMREMYDKGARFLMLATEEPTDKGFNHGTQKEMVWRQQLFPEAARLCEAILYLVPGEHVDAYYRQFAPASYIELGYAPSLLRRTDKVPTFEFGFFGSLTKRRERIIKRLARRLPPRQNIRVVASFPTQAERDELIRDCKVVLQLRKFDQMQLVSSSRCNTALCLGRPVVAEPHDLCKPWDEVVHFSTSEDAFYNDALLARSQWQPIYLDQFDKFKSKFTPQHCIGNALEKVRLLERMAA
jgi:hypothetical protein